MDAVSFLVLPAVAFAIVVGVGLAIAGIIQAFRLPHAHGAKFDVAARFLRWFIAALMTASAVWMVMSPRADQPVLDALERAFPAIRTAYMDDKALAVQDDRSLLREARGRAREECRWWIGAAFLVFALSILASQPRRTRAVHRQPA